MDFHKLNMKNKIRNKLNLLNVWKLKSNVIKIKLINDENKFDV